MSLLKSIDRLIRIDAMVRREGTGPSEEFAKKLGISRSMLMENLREMKELGAEICFCPHRRTYFYANNFDLVIGNIGRANVKGGGGICYFSPNENFLTQSNGVGPCTNILVSPSW